VARRSAGRLLYLCFEGMPPTVFDSQVMGFVRTMAGRDLVFDLYIFEGLRAALKNRTWNSERLAALRGTFPGRVTYVPLGTKFGFPLAASLFMSSLAPDLSSGKKLVVHSRGYYGAFLAALLKKVTHRIFSAYDVRGDAEAELKYRTAQEGDSVPFWRRFDSRLLRRIEGIALRKSDHIFCVSDALRVRLTERWGLEGRPMDVIPSCADPNLFRFDPMARERMRAHLKLADRMIMVYSGSMYRWQLVDKIIGLARHVMRTNPRLHLLLLTPDLAEARRTLSAALPAGSYTFLHVPHSRMPHYLAAADVGLLIRQAHALNQVACPTKFAEYVMCGLPVLVTDGLGDLAEFVRGQRIGLVLSDLDDLHPIDQPLAELLHESAGIAWKERAARIGREHFAWDGYAVRLADIYQRALDT
jgi:glycosyltransferase involved in cell wall biosynthesis